MREREPRSAAIRLLRHGVANAEVARRLRVPVATVGTWK
jgi:DNA-binding NarL/FixJ family response regulator